MKENHKTKQELIREIERLQKPLATLEKIKTTSKKRIVYRDDKGEIRAESDKIEVSGIDIEWDTEKGSCTFERLPVAMMWIESTLMGLMSGVQSLWWVRNALVLLSKVRGV